MRAKSSLRRARRAFALVVGLSLAAPWSLAPGGVPEASAQPRPAPRGAKVKKGKVDVAAQRAALLAQRRRRRAAAAAARSARPTTRPPAAALLEGLGAGQPWVAVAALAALGAAPRPRDPPRAPVTASGAPPAVRAAAVRALARTDAGASS
ncbi:MAG: hypothetical protein HS111_15905 [Kofleriaceae bacterium]|nr:hypothetical protein [Kofleriaceae bacterium]